MLIICYDFANDKTRARFAKFIMRYGHRVQYSVYVIKNSNRVLRMIVNEIERNYKKEFDKTDHVLIFPLCKSCQGKIIRYGSATHDLEDVVYL